jgi:subtilase family serine protease
MRLKSVAAIVLIAASFALAQETQPLRIGRPVDSRSTVPLRGTLSPRATVESDRGAVPAAMAMQHMAMVFNRTAAQQADLDRLLAEQQDKSSPNYRKWLTPEEYGDRFGLAQQDVNVVAAWLQSRGFTVDEIARSRTWIAFSGIAAQVDAAFQTQIHNYVVNGESHYAPSSEAVIPVALSDVVAAISGLHDFHPHARSRVRRGNPRLTSSLSGNHYMVPGDFGTIYNLPDYVNGAFQSGNDGSGQTIAIVGQTWLNSAGAAPYTDIDTFRSVSNLPALTVAPTSSTPNLTAVLAGTTDPKFVSTDIEEANLDVQWAGAVAPNANIVFVYSNDALLTSLPYITNHNLASVISVSYGECETNATASDFTTIETALQQANAQGQTVVTASGDSGATDCDTVSPATHGLSVDYPASSTHVTAMGGTEFTGDNAATVANNVAAATQYWNSSSDPNDTSASAFSYIPEMVWNDSSGTTISATGGGASSHFSKPSWQTGNGVPADGHRDVPDLALNSSPAHDGYIICSQGTCQTGYRRNSDQTFTVIGGTSAAVPTFAGIVALANQKMGVRQGNINSQIYPLASSSPWAFNDVTSGNNIVSCTTGSGCTNGSAGYSAGPGYDLVTGWGSVDATALLNALNGTPNPHFVVLPVSRSVSLAAGASATVSLSVTPKEGFTGAVALTCAVSTSLAGGTCTFDNSSVTTPGTANLTIQLASSQGAQTGTVTVQGTSGANTNAVVIDVTVTVPDFQLSSGNAVETVNSGSTTTDTISVTSVQGFSGSVNFSCSATSGLTCSLSPTPVTASTSAAVNTTLTVAASSSATTGSVTVAAASGTLSHTLQIPVTVNTVAADFTLTVANLVVSVPSGTPITDNLTVAPVGGFSSDVALTCSVPASLGTTTCTISPTTITGANGAALVTIRGAVLSMDRRPPLPFRHRGLGEYATFVFAFGIVFTVSGAPFYGSRKRSIGRGLIKTRLGLLLLFMMFGLASCGGGGGGSSSGTTPTPLNGNVTITGTSGSLTHTATINVTVH